MAFVLGPILCSISSGAIHNVSLSTFANEIVAPRVYACNPEAQYVTEGHIISSPTLTLHPYMALWIAAVPVENPSARSRPCHWENSFSNSLVTSVPDIAPLLRTSRTASSSSLVTIGQVNISPGSFVTAFGPPKIASSDILRLLQFNKIIIIYKPIFA